MRIRSDKHLQFIRGLPCIRCANPTATEAAHIRFADARIAKPICGQHKADDCYVLPLCSRCHRLAPDSQHTVGETILWASCGDPIIVIAWALKLYAFSGNHEEGERTVRAAHETMSLE